jgi:hypothetical protein
MMVSDRLPDRLELGEWRWIVCRLLLSRMGISWLITVHQMTPTRNQSEEQKLQSGKDTSLPLWCRLRFCAVTGPKAEEVSDAWSLTDLFTLAFALLMASLKRVVGV